MNRRTASWHRRQANLYGSAGIVAGFETLVLVSLVLTWRPLLILLPLAVAAMFLGFMFACAHEGWADGYQARDRERP